MLKSVISFDGTKIYYKIIKKGQPYLMLIHGVGSSSKIWEEEIKILSKAGFSLIAPDLRGHGISDKPQHRDAYFLHHFAHDIEHILRKEKINKIVPIGYSFGGVVSILYYNIYPHRINSMVLISTSYKMPIKLYFIYKIKYVIHKITRRKDDEKRKSIEALNHCISQMMEYSINFKKQNIKQLSNIKVPVLFIEGTKDRVIPVRHMENTCRFIKTASLNKIEGADHNIITTRREELNKQMLDFFNRNLRNIQFDLNKIAIASLLGIVIGFLSTPEALKIFVSGGITGAAISGLMIEKQLLGIELVFKTIISIVLLLLFYNLFRKK